MASAGARDRLDLVLVARGLVPTRSRARDLVARGLVRVDGVVADRPALLIGPDTLVTVAEAEARVASRGAAKLQAALDAFAPPIRGLVGLDIGASTGGFTEVLLASGAVRVYAVDVGRDQLAARLRDDPRVVVLEQQDARTLDAGLISEAPGIITADLSFISLTQALPAALTLAASNAWLIALVKPQFELGRAAIGKGGIVRKDQRAEDAVDRVAGWLACRGWSVCGSLPSPIIGGSGNREFLLAARRGGAA